MMTMPSTRNIRQLLYLTETRLSLLGPARDDEHEDDTRRRAELEARIREYRSQLAVTSTPTRLPYQDE